MVHSYVIEYCVVISMTHAIMIMWEGLTSPSDHKRKKQLHIKYHTLNTHRVIKEMGL